MNSQEQPKSQAWTGKSKGNTLGYAIFIKLLKIGGIRSAYFLLQFVAWYYILCKPSVTKHLHNIYHHRLGYAQKATGKLIRNNIRSFGQSIIDKIVVNSSQNENQFQVDNQVGQMWIRTTGGYHEFTDGRGQIQTDGHS